MTSPTEQLPPNRRNQVANCLHSTSNALFSLLSNPKPAPSSSPPKISIPFQFESAQRDSAGPKSSPAAAVKGISSSAADSSSGHPGFPSTVKIAGLSSDGKGGGGGGGPAFVGQVFSMCDLSGTGLMAVSTHTDIPFLSKRTPEWLKKMLATVTKSERNGPVFRFFMDLGDAVTYVKRLNIPSGVVGACRLDLAYEHFKEKPHLFQFVPNEKQVKAANQLLRTIPQSGRKKKIDGVPVFSAQNLDIAIATSDGIKWYTPYFFDKAMLDNILEESVDQHFHSMIQTRHMQRRRDVIDDNLAAEVIEELGDNLLEPPEVQEMMDEMGHHGIPLSVISKAAEIQLLYAVDRVLLGNRWLRKATGIQPKFPYMVDSFERRSASSFQRASKSIGCFANLETDGYDSTSEHKLEDSVQANNNQKMDLRLPFGDWFGNLWFKQQSRPEKGSKIRTGDPSMECIKQKLEPNPFLPKITMVGISTGEAGQMSKASLKKTMEDLTRELEQTDQGNVPGDGSSSTNEFTIDDRDPLFVANVGDYYSGMSKTGSPRWVQGGNH